MLKYIFQKLTDCLSSWMILIFNRFLECILLRWKINRIKFCSSVLEKFSSRADINKFHFGRTLIHFCLRSVPRIVVLLPCIPWDHFQTYSLVEHSYHENWNVRMFYSWEKMIPRCLFCVGMMRRILYLNWPWGMFRVWLTPLFLPRWIRPDRLRAEK